MRADIQQYCRLKEAIYGIDAARLLVAEGNRAGLRYALADIASAHAVINRSKWSTPEPGWDTCKYAMSRLTNAARLIQSTEGMEMLGGTWKRGTPMSTEATSETLREVMTLLDQAGNFIDALGVAS